MPIIKKDKQYFVPVFTCLFGFSGLFGTLFFLTLLLVGFKEGDFTAKHIPIVLIFLLFLASSSFMLFKAKKLAEDFKSRIIKSVEERVVKNKINRRAKKKAIKKYGH